MQTDYKKLFLTGNILLVGALYLFTEYYCSESCFVFYEKPYLDPLLIGLSGLLLTSILVCIFHKSIFISWLKKVVSWFLPLTLFMVASVEEGQGLFPMSSDGRSDTVILMMTLLFIITLVYALIMNRRLKKQGV